MKSLLIAFALLIAPPVYAQLQPHNDAGVTFGHVHLSVADPKVHHQLWVEQFGGVVSTKGTFTIVKMPNMMIAFRGTKPTGGTENTALNHFGLKVPNMAAALKKWRDAGRLTSSDDTLMATVEGAQNSFRSVLMAVAMNVFGLAPVMMATGLGADVMKTLATPMFGGLFSLVLLTVVVIPCVYRTVYSRAITHIVSTTGAN